MQVATALWIGGDLPWESLELDLCQEVYHCLPSELDEEDWRRIEKHLAVLRARARIEQESHWND